MIHVVALSVGRMLLGMMTALLTETFLRAVIIEALQMLVDRTKNEWDNKLLDKARAAWEK